ncbi:MAG: hydantoinase/oxoprolinase family protein [Proteobacteria bacterium]|nr:hydantoinase/oxoprolinase family protein [Pseudomonadota bacterium]MDA1354832.1 hydantoinase/oxoprolinase family protein [Pseudomonadota bacterium]
MRFNVCIDIGGTFTDCVVADDAGTVEIFKSPTTPGQFELGFMDALALAAAHHGLELPAFLATCERIVHGTTVSTNALVEGKTVPTGFLCNKGHPDILTFREAPRKRCFDFRLDYPKPYVPRQMTAEIGGRIDAQGREHVPLVENDVRAAVDMLQRRSVQAIAVCFLWSTVNPAHELRARAIVHEMWPEVSVTLSHELNPIPREYRRAISTAIDASLHPIVSAYTKALAGALEANGFDTDHFLVATCTGGMMPPDAIVAKPIFSVMSGPTLAPVAAQHLTNAPDVVVVDMGGTTFDVAAIRDRRLIVNDEAMIGDDMLGIPKVDVRSVGAGGGSIAWVDVGGMIQVGPQSASAQPGPACYGLGGTEPTVTDANVVLGLIDPDDFLGGRMHLDAAAAEKAVGTLGQMLGLGLIETALTIHTTSNHNMIAAIEDITVMEGINPRESFLVAGGGAIGCHIGGIARELGIRRFMLPRFAAGLSAFGGLISTIKWEQATTVFSIAEDFALAAVNEALVSMRRKGAAFLERAGLEPETHHFECVFFGRYEFQSWEIEVPFDAAGGQLVEADIAKLTADFHRLHERIYGVKDEEDSVEFVSWKVRAFGEVARLKGDSDRVEQTYMPASEGQRTIFLSDPETPLAAQFYRTKNISSGAVIDGPAVIADDTTTIVIHPGSVATADENGNLVVVQA